MSLPNLLKFCDLPNSKRTAGLDLNTRPISSHTIGNLGRTVTSKKLQLTHRKALLAFAELKSGMQKTNDIVITIPPKLGGCHVANNVIAIR